MVDLAEIQAAYYMVAATGVLVAAIYYVMNLHKPEEPGTNAQDSRTRIEGAAADP
jgi:hypothetical protein